MSDRDPSRHDLLRLRTALFDRITGLPSLSVMFDEMRSHLDRRRAIGLLHVSVGNLALAENVYGWQAFDRIIGRQAAELESMRGSELPQETMLAQLAIHLDEVIAVIPARASLEEVDAAYLQDLARQVEARMRARLQSEEFATIVPRLEPRVGFALLAENPFYRFERLVIRAVEEARARPGRSADRRRRSRGEEIQQVIRDGGIRVHYQPVVELETLEVMGYEALSRGPAGSGFESPAVLFELSEEAGIAADLDRLCRRLALDSARGIERTRKIFLNTRVGDLADPEWQDSNVERRLACLDLGPANLVVEIPQPGAFEETSLDRLVRDLKRRGFLFAIDDIGTGYAGIQTIERLEPDYLKVDISLVRRIDANLLQQDLLRSIISIGQRIGAGVIAEGIERSAELEVLKSHGTRYGQGFLFSAAVPTILPGPMRVGRDH